ncbi:MAG: YHS domain-containing protein, partial [Alphaproteobacteria bacterium]|nr:YHS domain-containing protein [Alphaproteobacteria bacterium]
MSVDPARTPHRAEHAGHAYFFCGARCRERFIAEPARFIPGDQSSERSSPTPFVAGAKWTCPMHPEIVRDGPGACPVCGMALEPLTPVAGEEPENPELRDMTRRLWVAAAPSVPLLASAMGRQAIAPLPP